MYNLKLITKTFDIHKTLLKYLNYTLFQKSLAKILRIFFNVFYHFSKNEQLKKN